MKELSTEQIERLRPEARERYEKRLKEVKKNRKIAMSAGIAFAVIAVCLVLSMTVLFNVSSITVESTGKKYTDEEIVMASGIDVGDNMVRTSFKKVEERIEKGLPYVGDAVITKTITGKVTVNITYTEAAIAVKTPQGFVLANSEGKVLETVKASPQNNKLMHLKIKGSVTATVGEALAINDANEKSLYDELMECLIASGLRGHITEMDISQRSSLKLVYQGRLRLLLGSSEKLDEKIKSAAEVIGKENEDDPSLIAEINLTIPKKAFVNPVESLDETNEDDDSSTQIINPEEGKTSSTGEGDGEESTKSDADSDESEPDAGDEEMTEE